LQAFSGWISPGAAYDSQIRFPPSRCHPGTRTEILSEIEGWIGAGRGGTKLLWLHGPAGAGKSAIAQTVAETCAEHGQLAASFFFSRSSPVCDAMKHLFPTIALQISMASPHKRQKLQRILRDNPYIAHRVSGSIEILSRCSVTSPVRFLIRLAVGVVQNPVNPVMNPDRTSGPGSLSS